MHLVYYMCVVSSSLFESFPHKYVRLTGSPPILLYFLLYFMPVTFQEVYANSKFKNAYPCILAGICDKG